MHAFVLSHSAFHGQASRRPPATSSLRRARPSATTPAHASQSSPDVLVVGGGAAGLSTAYHLAKDGASVRVLSPPHRDPAMRAAAGMLAPLAENTSGRMHALCASALAHYPPFVDALSRDAPHLDLQFRAQNHYLAPALRGDRPPVSPHADFPPAAWLSGRALSAREPALSPLVTEAAFLPGDASIDNRRLYAALHHACVARGVRVDPVSAQRVQTDAAGRTVQAVVTDAGELLSAAHYVVAAGAWTRTVLPGVPVHPVKGQMLSLRAPAGCTDARLRHALFGKHVYVVPRDEDDLYVVGATVEPAAGFALHNTAGGVRHLLDAAMQLVPAFEHFELAETWAGVRPTTPDMQPLFGLSHCDNLSVVSGFHRYGILLTPIAGRLAAAVATGTTDRLPRELGDFLEWFSPRRFDTGDFEHVPVVPLGASGVAAAAAATVTGTAEPAAPAVRNESAASVSAIDGSTSPPSSPAVSQPRPVPVPQVVQEAATSNEAASPKRPMLLKILDDGSEEEVSAPPGWKPMAAPTATRGGVGLGLDYDVIDSSFVVSSSIPQSAKKGGASAPKKEEAPVGEKTTTARNAPTYTASVENPESVSGENDAYEDIMAKRNQVGNDERARAANRAFGRPKSSLQGDGEGDATLSLSEAESRLFDAAFEEGLKEMEEFAKSFDPNDPSVQATKKDVEAYEAFESTLGVNGATTLNQASAGEQFSEDGYF